MSSARTGPAGPTVTSRVFLHFLSEMECSFLGRSFVDGRREVFLVLLGALRFSGFCKVFHSSWSFSGFLSLSS